MVCIGIKYCGGCFPQYDRVALVERLKERLGDKAVFTSYDDESSDLILIVCGCESACVNTEEFAGKEFYTIFKKESVYLIR